ncbi:TIGR03943 family protein [Gloeocapsopsis crepidinum LEGE 06123]|uniref:TIGR03943 family protein n=1 Tax=Gloeocapsopsis crepidinum LEGE 06123 TaxID=588587 RepID=A0ABR9UWZ6_9CHRO|nr:TIGR03943 family protein [Gloeocapsopsis crepidinum]MBE9192817.1 TIGR03943 family protein [Gloeocapsopsis crepidinum LEGE 06123]
MIGSKSKRKQAKLSPNQSKTRAWLFTWLDVLAIGAWGILMLRYWLTGKLNLLIHPDYFWLVISGGIGLIIIAASKAWELLRRRRNSGTATQHVTLFPPGISSSLLLVTAIIGMTFTPRVFASQTALDRGVTDSLGATRAQPQAFRSARNPEERSLLDWVRTLNVYPEPDAYTGQSAKVQGFVIHPPELPPEYILISRFVITCCAADAYPVGLPVKLSSSRQAYPPDTWLEIEGTMMTDTLAGKRQLTIQATSLTQIAEPENPYEY